MTVLRKHTSLLLTSWMLTGACNGTLRVETSSPGPAISFPLNATPDLLRLGHSVDDRFEIPRYNSVGPVRVRGWRETIQNGFDASFGANARDAGEFGTSSSLVLVLNHVDLGFVSRQKRAQLGAPQKNSWDGMMAHPSAAHRSPARPPDPVVARIDFAAVLFRDGKEGRRMAATVFSKLELRGDLTPSLIAKSAIEEMYVAIATEFFVAAKTKAESR